MNADHIRTLHQLWFELCSESQSYVWKQTFTIIFWSLKTRPNQKGNSYELQPSFIQRRATILPTQILSSHWSIANHPSNPMSTHHRRPSTIHSLLSTIYYRQSSIHRLLSTVFHSQFTIKRVQSTVHPLPSIAYRHLLIINSPSSTVYNTPSTVYLPNIFHLLPTNHKWTCNTILKTIRSTFS